MARTLLLVAVFCAISVYCAEANDESDAKHKGTIYIPIMYHSSHYRPLMEVARVLHDRGYYIIMRVSEEYEGIENPSVAKREAVSDEVLVVKSGISPKFMQEMCAKLTEFNVFDFVEYFSLFSEFGTLMSHMLVTSFVSSRQIVAERQVDLIIADASDPALFLCDQDPSITCIASSPFALRPGEVELLYLDGELPQWMPPTSLGYGLASSLLERVRNQLCSLFLRFFMHVFMVPMGASVRSSVNVTAPKLIHPTFVSTFQGFDFNVPLPPHVKFVGLLHSHTIESARLASLNRHELVREKIDNGQEPLDVYRELQLTDIDQYLEESANVIVISFGKSVELNERYVDIMMKFIKQTPSPVLWTLRERHLHLIESYELPSNLRIETWVNLPEVLAHPHVAMLVSQCGVATCHEALLCGVPQICIPMLYDQYDLGVRVAMNQVGETLLKEELTTERLLEHTESVIAHSAEYRANAAALRQLHELSPRAEDIADWIEVIYNIGEHHVAPHVRFTPRVIPWEYNEVRIFFLLIVVTMFLWLPLLWRCALYLVCCRCCRKSKPTIAEKTKSE